MDNRVLQFFATVLEVEDDGVTDLHDSINDALTTGYGVMLEEVDGTYTLTDPMEEAMTTATQTLRNSCTARKLEKARGHMEVWNAGFIAGGESAGGDRDSPYRFEPEPSRDQLVVEAERYILADPELKDSRFQIVRLMVDEIVDALVEANRNRERED